MAFDTLNFSNEKIERSSIFSKNKPSNSHRENSWVNPPCKNDSSIHRILSRRNQYSGSDLTQQKLDNTLHNLQLKVPDILRRTTDSFHKSNLPLPLLKQINLNTQTLQNVVYKKEDALESPKVKFIKVEEQQL